MSKLTTQCIIQLSFFCCVAFSFCRVMIYLLDIVWFIQWTVLRIYALPTWSGWPAENNHTQSTFSHLFCVLFCPFQFCSAHTLQEVYIDHFGKSLIVFLGNSVMNELLQFFCGKCKALVKSIIVSTQNQFFL